MSISGLALISYALFNFSKTTPFPGYFALAPALGAFLIIYAGELGKITIHHILTFKPMVFIGLISYSLYLWHWPIIVYTKYYLRMQPIENYWPILLFACVTTASFSYKYIEQPFRAQNTSWPRLRLFKASAITASILLFLGSISWLSHGFSARYPQNVVALDNKRSPQIPFIGCMAKAPSNVQAGSLCEIGDLTQPLATMVLWGDSHALAWMPAIDRALRNQKVRALFAGHSACPPLFDVIMVKDPNSCLNFNNAVHQLLQRTPSIKAIMLIADWPEYSSEKGDFPMTDIFGSTNRKIVFSVAIDNTLHRLEKLGLTPLVVGPVPGAPSYTPLGMAFSLLDGKHFTPGISLPNYLARNEQFFKNFKENQYDRTRLLDIKTWFCNQVECIYQTDGFPLYRDSNHLSAQGSLYFLRNMETSLSKLELGNITRS